MQRRAKARAALCVKTLVLNMATGALRGAGALAAVARAPLLAPGLAAARPALCFAAHCAPAAAQADAVYWAGHRAATAVERRVGGGGRQLPAAMVPPARGARRLSMAAEAGTAPAGRRLCVAPMMDWTDRFDRYFLRRFSKNTWLYTEMVTTGAIIHGDQDRHLSFFKDEHPIAVQLGGSDPDDLAKCAAIAEGYGYDEINLNVGCPSERVSSGSFGACLMAEPVCAPGAPSLSQAPASLPPRSRARSLSRAAQSCRSASDLNASPSCR